MLRFRGCPQVQQCYYVTGDTNFVQTLSVDDMEEYEGICGPCFWKQGR